MVLQGTADWDTCGGWYQWKCSSGDYWTLHTVKLEKEVFDSLFKFAACIPDEIWPCSLHDPLYSVSKIVASWYDRYTGGLGVTLLTMTLQLPTLSLSGSAVTVYSSHPQFWLVNSFYSLFTQSLTKCKERFRLFTVWKQTTFLGLMTANEILSLDTLWTQHEAI